MCKALQTHCIQTTVCYLSGLQSMLQRGITREYAKHAGAELEEGKH